MLGIAKTGVYGTWLMLLANDIRPVTSAVETFQALVNLTASKSRQTQVLGSVKLAKVARDSKCLYAVVRK